MMENLIYLLEQKPKTKLVRGLEEVVGIKIKSITVIIPLFFSSIYSRSTFIIIH